MTPTHSLTPPLLLHLGLQVTRHDLQELMPTIRDAIHRASFVAVDCEMTGLFDYEPKPWYLDDMQTRYEDVRCMQRGCGRVLELHCAALMQTLSSHAALGTLARHHLTKMLHEDWDPLLPGLSTHPSESPTC